MGVLAQTIPSLTVPELSLLMVMTGIGKGLTVTVKVKVAPEHEPVVGVTV